ncbi:meiosis-specific nuclear structural protein 1-like isoform X1 [Chelonia mydas]|uniref:meiosis-specific nuclear structural protein 1-like isoform X1 n=2 Tax=Chelonia mydas TaxID=8469 RepID=UPI0018A1D96A|nr:meiosis-specific nuclear structural protein 1-like isoform X1 [Chelonia mydas]
MQPEKSKKFSASKMTHARNLAPSFKQMDTLSSIEAEYIKNLQKEVYLLELETSFLREQAKKATSIQPKISTQAEKVLQKMKELQSEINTAQLELGKKENSTKFFDAENQAMHKHLQILSDANTREKLLLMEDVIKLKKLAEIVTQDISHKEAELLGVQQELQRAMNSMKEREHDLHHLENQLHRQIQQHQSTEAKLVENRSECVRVQALLHQLEEKYFTSSQSMEQHIAKELREEAEKLRQQLKEKELSADEDKYLRNKMAEDCGYLTKENGLLQSQVLEATRQLDREKQLREDESTCHTRRISELACEKEKERQLEMELTYLKRLLQDERQKALTAQEQVLRLQQGRKSVNLNGQSLQSQQKDLERRWSRAQLENSKLRTEKTHLVEHISQLHKQISEKEDEIRRMHGHVSTMSYDLNSLKSQVETEHSLQRERWKEFSNILTAYKSPAK